MKKINKDRLKLIAEVNFCKSMKDQATICCVNQILVPYIQVNYQIRMKL